MSFWFWNENICPHNLENKFFFLHTDRNFYLAFLRIAIGCPLKVKSLFTASGAFSFTIRRSLLIYRQVKLGNHKRGWFKIWYASQHDRFLRLPWMLHVIFLFTGREAILGLWTNFVVDKILNDEQSHCILKYVSCLSIDKFFLNVTNLF